MYSTKDDLIGLLEARADTGHKTFQHIDALFKQIFAALRRDPRFAGITPFELELLVAGVRDAFEQQLFSAMRDRLHVDDDAACR